MVKVAVTRFHFLTPVGETQESYYEQKYLLNVPIMPDDCIITNPPRSWMQLCVEKDLCNKEGDALSCLHTAVSKGFKYDDLKDLVQLFVDNAYLSAPEGHTFMADIPLGTEIHEEEAEVTDALLTDSGTEYRTLLPSTTQNVHSYVSTFMPSQKAAFQWLTDKFNSGISCHCWPSRDWKILCAKCSGCPLQEERIGGCKASTKWCCSTSD